MLHCNITNKPAEKTPSLMSRPPLFISAPLYQQSGFSGLHPLAISRIGAVENFARALGWLGDDNFRCSPVADRQTLTRYHDKDYVAALARVCDDNKVTREDRERYQFGTMENPIFPALFERASTCVGGSILAAQCAAKNQVVFHPAGGTHHGKKNQASGFCYFNDPVFAILTLRDQGLARIAYIDLDAHHGDGVEAAFGADKSVLCFSIHEEKRWPHSGAKAGKDDNNNINLPVPRGLHDQEFVFLMETCLWPQLEIFKPDALVIVCGADVLAGDPLSAMTLTNQTLWQTVKQLTNRYTASVVLGGGGYNPWTTVRYWTGLWGVLNANPMPTPLPPELTQILRGFSSDLVDEEDVQDEWLTQLQDSPPAPLPLREEIKKIGAPFAAL